MSNCSLTRREAAALSGADEATVKKAIDQRIILAKREGTTSRIDVRDLPLLVLLDLLKGDVRLLVQQKRELRNWLRQSAGPEVFDLTPLVQVKRPVEIDEVMRRADRYTRLRDAWIVRDPAVKGGEPVIRGSRVGVYSLASRIEAGESGQALDEDFPRIPAEARDIAVQYARANPRRGRPARAAAAA